jgi:hypothetical protein
LSKRTLLSSVIYETHENGNSNLPNILKHIFLSPLPSTVLVTSKTDMWVDRRPSVFRECVES